MNTSFARRAVFWCSASLMICAVYWAALSYCYPGYFAPLSPFHLDFYASLAIRNEGLSRVLLHYPRPAAYLATKVIATWGLTGLMVSEIAIALTGVLLTVALARRVLLLRSSWLLCSLAIYSFLLFAHPDFYYEHRHDLPAELSYVLLLSTLLLWLSCLDQPAVSAERLMLRTAAIFFAAAFVLAKETFFLSALVLVAGLALAQPRHRRAHVCFGAVLLTLEVASLVWNRHLNGPFVNTNSDPSFPYFVNFSPSSLASTYGYYLSHLLTPVLAVITAGGLWLLRKRKGDLAFGIAMVLAGLLAAAPQAVLPNHRIEEYAWAGAPLLLAPILTLLPVAGGLRLQAAGAATLALLMILAVAGPAGYAPNYDSALAHWLAGQDRHAGLIADSLPRFAGLPPSSRILVTGLDEPAMPWQVADYVRSEFGDKLLWTVAVPPRMDYRHNSRFTQFVDASEVRLEDFDYVARYESSGRLVTLVPRLSRDKSQPWEELLVPDLDTVQGGLRSAKGDLGLLMKCADISVLWGFWKQAGECLGRAEAKGVLKDSTYNRLVSEWHEGWKRQEAAATEKFALVAEPSRVTDPDEKGLGITELRWVVPKGAVCELRINSPGGQLFASAVGSGKTRTGRWVKRGMRFYLQDIRNGKPLTEENTVAMVQID